jgi:hypothetical protein
LYKYLLYNILVKTFPVIKEQLTYLENHKVFIYMKNFRTIILEVQYEYVLKFKTSYTCLVK